MKTVSENASFGGMQGVYRHASDVCGCEMTFAVYLPPQAKRGRVPVLWFLSGLTCTDENAVTKAGAQVWLPAARIAVVFRDTSPRGDWVANDAAFDLGQGGLLRQRHRGARGVPHFRMWDYVVDELPDLVFGAPDAERLELTGRSMGGHGTPVNVRRGLSIAVRRSLPFAAVSFA